MNPALDCRLPDGRALGLARDVGLCLRAGVVALSGARVDGGPGAAEATAALAPGLRDRYRGLLPGQIPALESARTLYKTFGMDPSRHRPSSEALLRRVLKGQDLYRINSAVDCCNLASLTFVLPIGMYDLDRIEGDVTLRLGADGEGYPGIRKGPVNLAGRLGLFDRQGPFGSPTSDSGRTSVEAGTSRILAVIMADGAYPAGAMADRVAEFARLFATHCGATCDFGGVLGGEG